MKYLKIENPGRLDRLALRYWGFTTKREAFGDESIVGKNGSGSKYAPLSAYRSGLGFAVSSVDDQGPYLLTYENQEVAINGQTERAVIFHYLCINPEDGTPFVIRHNPDLLMTAFLEWDKPIGSDDNPAFKSLREILGNARDVGGGSKLHRVDCPEMAEDGQVAVYLRCTDDVERMIRGKDVPRYFKFIGSQKAIIRYRGIGAIYYKSDPNNTRLFAQGVLVGCYPQLSISSVYDYSLSDKDVVSEERLIKNYWTYVDGVAGLFARIVNEKVTERIVRAVVEGRAMFEESVLGRIGSYVPLSKSAWLNAVHEVFGTRIAIASDEVQADSDCEQIFGYKIIKPKSDDVRRFLRSLGIPKAKEIVPVGDAFKYERIDPSEIEASSRARFEQAFQMFVQDYPERAHLPIAFFHPLTEAMKKYAAVARFDQTRLGSIWIGTVDRTKLLTVAHLYESLVHESRHCVTGSGDYTRTFIDQADLDAVRGALRRHGIQHFGDGTEVPPSGDGVERKPTYLPMTENEFVIGDYTDSEAIFIEEI